MVTMVPSWAVTNTLPLVWHLSSFFGCRTADRVLLAQRQDNGYKNTSAASAELAETALILLRRRGFDGPAQRSGTDDRRSALHGVVVCNMRVHLQV